MANIKKCRKQQENILKTLIMTTFVTICATLILIIGYVYVNFSIHRNQYSLENLSKELTDLQKEVDEAKIKKDEYKRELEQLQAHLSKYQEVIIPESMAS